MKKQEEGRNVNVIMVFSSVGYMRIAKWVLLYNSGVISRTVFLHLARRAVDRWWEHARTKERDARLLEQIHKEIEEDAEKRFPLDVAPDPRHASHGFLT